MTADLSPDAQIANVREKLKSFDQALKSARACGLTIRLETHDTSHVFHDNKQLKYQGVRIKEAFVPL